MDFILAKAASEPSLFAKVPVFVLLCYCFFLLFLEGLYMVNMVSCNLKSATVFLK